MDGQWHQAVRCAVLAWWPVTNLYGAQAREFPKVKTSFTRGMPPTIVSCKHAMRAQLRVCSHSSGKGRI